MRLAAAVFGSLCVTVAIGQSLAGGATALARKPAAVPGPPASRTATTLRAGAAAAVAAARATAARHAAQLATAAARTARARSRTEYQAQDAVGALATDAHAFPGSVTVAPRVGLLAEPTEHVVHYVGPDQAVVTAGAGARHSLLVSALPLRAPTATGALRPVNLALVRHGRVFSPAVPLAAATFAASTSSPASFLRLTGSGVTVAPVHASARRAELVSGHLIYPNTYRDTDLMVTPFPAGADVSWIARSRNSPELYALRFTLPKGARVLDATGPGGVGGVQIVNASGSLLATIPAPAAVDAQGASVPVSMAALGNQLVITVKHRGGSYAYPILTDPYISEDQRYWNGQLPEGTSPTGASYGVPDFNGWAFTSVPTNYVFGEAGNIPSINTAFGSLPFGNGLFMANDPGFAYPSLSFGQWVFRAPGVTTGPYANEASHIFKADFGYTAHVPGYFPSGVSDTIEEQGIFNSATGQPETGLEYRGAAVSSPYTAGVYATSGLDYNPGNFTYHVFCLSTCNTSGGSPSLGSPSNEAALLMYVGAGTPQTEGVVYMGSSLIFESDNYPPHIDVSQVPTGWTDTGPVTINATDYGVGAYQASASAPGWAGANTGVPSCSQSANGSANNGSEGGAPGSPNTGDRNNRCPIGVPLPLSFDAAQLPEGSYALTANATDVVQNASPAVSVPILIDHTPPTVTLSGSLDNTSQTLPPASYTLNVSATDGSTGTAAAERSGVASIEVDLDGQQAQSASQPCSAAPYSCPMTQTYTLNTTSLAPGVHTIDVLVDDQLGHETQQTFNFTTGPVAGPCCATAQTTWMGTLGLHLPLTEDVAYGDVTGDGLADLVTRSKLNGAVQVGIGAGSSFATTSTWGTWPTALLGLGTNADLRVADVDGDGRADLVGRDPVTGNVYVALSNGTSFGVPNIWATTSPSDSYYTTDLYGDGEQDLVTRNVSTGVISAATVNDQGNGWDPPQQIDTLPATWNLYFADLDGSGDQALVGMNPSNGQVNVALPNGDGSYGSPTVWATIPTSGVDTSFGDMDGTGKTDLVTRNQSTGEVDVRFSNGTTSFGNPVDWGALSVDHDFNVLDLTGDFKADVIGRNALGDISASVNEMNTPLNEDDTSFTPDPGLIYDVFNSPLVSGILRSAPIAQAASAPRMILEAEDDATLGPATANPPPLNTTTFDTTARRVEDMGATRIRYIVYWGRWQGSQSYRTDLMQAAQRAESQGEQVYLTLTGADYDTIGGKPTSNFLLGGPDGFSGDPTINPAAYASWVGSVVSTFKSSNIPIVGYGLWNEPNKDTRTFLAALCPGVSQGTTSKNTLARLNTADLYGQLYQRGYAAAKAADPNAQLYFGELDGFDQAGRATCTGKPMSGTLPLWLARAVADAPGLPIYTKGVAWHAYQHYTPPSSANSTQGNSHGYYGIGRIDAVQTEITHLAGTGKLLVVPAQSGQKNVVPGLYITEFGYFNRPNDSAQPNSTNIHAVHAEAARATLFTQALNWLIRPAKKGEYEGAPALLSFYGVVEAGVPYTRPGSPTGTDYTGVFDTGFVAPSGAVTGTRIYGRDPSGKDTTYVDYQQPRAAYCSISAWATQHGYHTTLQQPGDPDHC